MTLGFWLVHTPPYLVLFGDKYKVQGFVHATLPTKLHPPSLEFSKKKNLYFYFVHMSVCLYACMCNTCMPKQEEEI